MQTTIWQAMMMIPGRASLLQVETLKAWTVQIAGLGENRCDSADLCSIIPKHAIDSLGDIATTASADSTMVPCRMEPTLQSSIPTAACFM